MTNKMWNSEQDSVLVDFIQSAKKKYDAKRRI